MLNGSPHRPGADPEPIPDPTTPSSNTRKRQYDYASLHNHGLQGPLAPSTPTQATSVAKRARKNAAKQSIPTKKSQKSSQQPETQSDGEEASEPEEEKSRRHAWFWQYYTIEVQEKKWEKGTGKRKTLVPDEVYTCNIDPKRCVFSRKASKLHGSTTALGDHIEKHKVFKETDPQTARTNNPTTLTKWMRTPENQLPQFETALVDWIIADCQAFVVTESDWFRRMMKAAGCEHKIPKGDTIASRVHGRVGKIEVDLTKLLQRTCSTLALSLDGWTSQNTLPILCVRGHWCGPDFKVYQVLLEFVEIDGTHSGENLSEIVFLVLKRLGVLQKLISVTGDNASNNDTLSRHLYNRMSRLYDNHLEKFPIRDASMRFEGEKSQIRCFAHILNLVCKAILASLGSSTHKDATEFLTRAENQKWSKITLPGAAGDIHVLRIIVLWIGRSPVRLQEWDARSKKRIPYDVDTRWNYALRMLECAFDCRAALTDTVKDNPQLHALELTPERWERLAHIRTLLQPFNDLTKYVSRAEPTIQMSAQLYLKLQKILQSVVRKEGGFEDFDTTLITAAKAGLEKFDEYYGYMKQNDTYWIASVLDPRIKTKWLKKNLPDADKIIKRIKTFLKDTYPVQVELLQNHRTQQKKGLDLEFLEEYGSMVAEADDIDRYFDTDVVLFQNQGSGSQMEWLRNWWNTNTGEFPCMAAAARDYLPIPSAETDVERVFNDGREILGIRRYAMSGSTMRALLVCKDELRRQKNGQI